MITKGLWKSTIEEIKNNKWLHKDEKRYDDYANLGLIVLMSLFTIPFDVILFPFELIIYFVYEKI